MTMFLYAGTRCKGVLFSGLAGALVAAPPSGWRVQMGKYYAHRASPAPGGKNPSQALWRHRARGVLAHGGAGRARARGIAVWHCGCDHQGNARPGLAFRNPSEPPAASPFAPMASLLEAVAAAAPRFDVIHCHLDWVHIPLLQRLQVPFLTTLHNRLDLPYLRNAARSFAKAPFVSISNNQREPLPGLNWLGTVHHGLPAAMLEFSRHSGGYLAFLGRIDPEKGPETAIRLAKASGLPLRIAAKVPSGKNQYFRDRIQPLVDGSQIQFIGE